MTAAAQTNKPPPATAPAADGAEALATTGTLIAEQALSAQRHLSDRTLAFANEVMGFASRRMQAQAEFMARLGQCHDPADLLDTQLRFVADATSDYAAEFTALARVMQPQD